MPQTPEERRIEKETARKAAEAAKAVLSNQVNSVLQTDAGKAVFRYLFGICGFDKPSRVETSTGAIDPIGTTCNDERRSVYLQLRAHADPRLLADVEYAAQKEIKKEEKNNA